MDENPPTEKAELNDENIDDKKQKKILEGLYLMRLISPGA